MNNSELTIVVFRKFKNDGEVIALFPHEKGTLHYCMSYMHVGQHSDADYKECLSVTERAYESDYKALKSELESIGYNLKVKIRK